MKMIKTPWQILDVNSLFYKVNTTVYGFIRELYSSPRVFSLKGIFDEDVVIIVISKIKVFDNYKVDILEYFESLDGVLDIIKITGVECYCILFSSQIRS